MMKALYTGGTGMVAQQTNVDTIANNLANVNTTGYKLERAEFADLLYQNLQDPGARTSEDTQLPTGMQLGSGVALQAINKIYSQGALLQTGNSFDVAIEGDGFFQIQMPDGTTAYTRAGNFNKDSQGRLVTPQGYLLTPNITIPQGSVGLTIAPNGMVSVTDPNTQQSQNIGQITLARFINPSGLLNIGQNLVVETPASGTPVISNPMSDGAGSLQQFYLESSNVSVVSEMTNLIIAQRAYEMNSKTITTADSMLQIASNLKR
ncbi:MAG: flagellar basal-body rod protein FlgG [Negativicutes bacterium]|nr:flagellar basal-body rod protein FlgG [Negativicutes bacterium]